MISERMRRQQQRPVQFMQFSENLFKSSSIRTLNIIIVCINLMLETFNCISKFSNTPKEKKHTHTFTVYSLANGLWYEKKIWIVYSEWCSVFFIQLFRIICWIYNWFNLKIIKIFLFLSLSHFLWIWFDIFTFFNNSTTMNIDIGLNVVVVVIWN